MPLALRKTEAAEPRTIPEWLASRDTALQRKAESALAGMGMDHATGYLIEIASKEEAKRRRRTKWCVYTALAAIWIPMFVLAAQAIFQHHGFPDLVVAGGLTSLILVVQRRAARTSPLHRAALHRLAANMTDTVALPIFVDALWETEDSVKEAVIPPLIDMLEQIQSPDALSNRQWATLANCLADRTSRGPKLQTYYQKLAVAILNAMERTGYAGCIKSVNRLRTEPPCHLNTSEVFRAADACWLACRGQATQGLTREP